MKIGPEITSKISSTHIKFFIHTYNTQKEHAMSNDELFLTKIKYNPRVKSLSFDVIKHIFLNIIHL